MGQGERNVQSSHLRTKKHHLESGFGNNGDIKKLMKKNFVTPFYGWGSTAAKLQSHYEGIIYFLPLNPQKFVAVILLTLEEEKAESALESPSRKFVYI